MRIFEPLEEMELHDGDKLIGVYVPGLRYNAEDGGPLAEALDAWIEEGKVKIIETRDEPGTGPSEVAGKGEVQ